MYRSSTESDPTLLTHQEEAKISYCPEKLSQQETAITQPMKSHYTLKFQFTPKDFWFTKAHPKSIKERSSPLFL